MSQAVHFGAGAIGRGFVADLLHKSGYTITFVDVNDTVIDAINTAGGYDIYWIEEDLRREHIDQVRGVHSRDEDAVIQALVEADLATTSVWASNLHRLAPVIAKALEARATAGRGPLVFVPCENAVGNGQILAAAVAEQLPERNAAWIHSNARFPSTAVDRMVFDASQRDGVVPVDAGLDYELVIERGDLPDEEPIAGAHYVDDLGPFLKRKLFIINGGHARAAYLGSLRGYTTTPEIFADVELLTRTRASMLQAAAVMEHDYGFAAEELEEYVDFALRRWQTAGVVDEVARVGRAPIRKLAHDERLVAPAIRAQELGLPHYLLLEGIAAALLYRNENDEEAAQLRAAVKADGPEAVLANISGLTERDAITTGVLQAFNELRRNPHGSSRTIKEMA